MSNARLRPLARLHPPAQPCSPEPGPFNEIEKLAFFEELFQLAYAVAAELAILSPGVNADFLGVQAPVRVWVIVPFGRTVRAIPATVLR